MPKAHRRVPLILGAAIATAAVATIPALATNVVKIDSKVTISPPRAGVSRQGEIRQQRLRVESQGEDVQEATGPDELLGHDRTNNRGKWKVEIDPLSSGAYYARVKRRAEGAAGTIFVCGGSLQDGGGRLESAGRGRARAAAGQSSSKTRRTSSSASTRRSISRRVV